MKKLHLPKNHITGIKVFCKKCRQNNTSCNHYHDQVYRVMIHVPGTKGNTRSKMLKSRNYDDAIEESILFKKSIVTNQFNTPKETTNGNDYSLKGSLIKYYRYLNGNEDLKQRQKVPNTKEYVKEQIRYCKKFIKSVIQHRNTSSDLIHVVSINDEDVSNFYDDYVEEYQPRTFNKMISELKRFFGYLIDIKKIQMTNPFDNCVKKKIKTKNPEIMVVKDFLKIIESVENENPIKEFGGKGSIRNMYRDYLIDGFFLFLFTGGRFDEVVNLKWSDIKSHNDTEYFFVENYKVNQQLNIEGEQKKYKRFPIFPEFKTFLNKMGYEDKRKSNDYILVPNRTIKSKTMSNQLSKSFSHYRNQCGVSKSLSLKHLRKTYITQVYKLLDNDTGLVTSHSSDKVLRNHYVEQKTLSATEKLSINLSFLN